MNLPVHEFNCPDNSYDNNFVNDLQSVLNLTVWCLSLCQIRERINLVVFYKVRIETGVV